MGSVTTTCTLQPGSCCCRPGSWRVSKRHLRVSLKKKQNQEQKSNNFFSCPAAELQSCVSGRLGQPHSLSVVGCHTMANRWMCSEMRGETWSKLGKDKSGPPRADFLEYLAVQGERRSRISALRCEGFEPKQSANGIISCDAHLCASGRAAGAELWG